MIIGFSQGFVLASSQPSSRDPYDSTEPVDPLCGDGRLDPGEECDDGNNGPYDGCSPRCLREFCGDGFVQAEMREECDNGSICSHNELLFCRQDLDCRSCLPVPGVGVTRCGGDAYAKLCRTNDDCMLVNFVCMFNKKRDPTCTNVCRFFRSSSSSSSVRSSLISVALYEPVCGNGILDIEEECDEGEANADDLPNACRTDCLQPFCGDGVWDDLFGEACDQGEWNADDERDRCRTNCMLPLCGDGVLDSGEQCDDGNMVDNDGCSGECLVPEIWCGNGVIESGEQCDDGNISFGDGCSPVCTMESDIALLVQETCGDGVVDFGEQCDDGNVRSGDGCSSLCQDEVLVIDFVHCGNGVLEPGEQCDDGNASDIDGCDRLCRGAQFRFAASVTQPRAFVGDTGPAVIVIMASGAAAGYAWMRRKFT